MSVSSGRSVRHGRSGPPRRPDGYRRTSPDARDRLRHDQARAHTGREDVIVLEHAYHGHTSGLIDISPFKFDGPGGRGRKPWVHVAPLPDDYRGPYRRDDPEAGTKYAAAVGRLAGEAAARGGLAVLDVVRDERLQERALRVGGRFIAGLKHLAERHPVVGDVRGFGLFLGLELVRERRTLEPAAAEASYVLNRLRELGILTGPDGPFHNVIKIRPPLCFSEADADLFVTTLDEVLTEDPVRIG